MSGLTILFGAWKMFSFKILTRKVNFQVKEKALLSSVTVLIFVPMHLQNSLSWFLGGKRPKGVASTGRPHVPFPTHPTWGSAERELP